MGCWRWFGGVLKEAGVTVTPKNRAKVDKVIHQYIGEHAEYEHCSADWSKMGKKVKMDAAMEKKLVEAVKTALK